MKKQSVVFTGGEPLMYDKLSNLIKLTSKLEMKQLFIFFLITGETLNNYRDLIDIECLFIG